MYHTLSVFFCKEEDAEETDVDNSSSDDGYPKDKKTCFMCKECFPSYSKLTQHQVLCKNNLKCLNIPSQEWPIHLSKTLFVTLNCAMGMGHLDAHIVLKCFPIIIWLGITSTGVKVKE